MARCQYSLNVFAANNLAYILAEDSQDLPTALKWAEVARKLQPDNPEIADTLSWVFYKQGNCVLARDQFRFALDKQPNNEVIWYHLGATSLKCYQLEEAEAALKRALGTNRDVKERSLAQSALAELKSKSR